MHWHWLIVIYLFLGGLGAGAYLTSFAAEKGLLGKNSSLARSGYYISAPVVAFGTLLLVFDLGQGLKKPLLLFGLLSNFHSVMTWGVYILSLFIIVGLLKGFLVFKNRKTPEWLTWAGAVFALATGTYTGLLISVVAAIPFWNTWIMPILFVVSALSTGLSLTSLLALVVERGSYNEGREGQAHILLIAAEIVIVLIFIGLMSSGSAVAKESLGLLISGVYKLIFWGCFIALGLLIPLAVFTYQYLKMKRTIGKFDTEPAIGAEESAATLQKGQHSYLSMVSDVFVLIGGFALRVLIIFAAIPVWDGFTIH